MTRARARAGKGLGFRVKGLGFRVLGLGFKLVQAWGLELSSKVETMGP